MIALIDNYDSFTFNLYQYLSEFAETKVFRNDEITVEELRELNPKGIVISPGPGVPEDAGISIEVIKKLGDKIPIFGNMPWTSKYCSSLWGKSNKSK